MSKNLFLDDPLMPQNPAPGQNGPARQEFAKEESLPTS